MAKSYQSTNTVTTLVFVSNAKSVESPSKVVAYRGTYSDVVTMSLGIPSNDVICIRPNIIDTAAIAVLPNEFCF